MKVWGSLTFNVCTRTNKTECCFHFLKKWTQKFVFLGNISGGKSRNITSGSLSCWSSMTQTSPLKRRAAKWLCSGSLNYVSALPSSNRQAKGMWRQNHFATRDEMSKFNRDFFPPPGRPPPLPFEDGSPWQEISEKSTASFSCPFLWVFPYETMHRLPRCTLLLWQEKMNF